MMAKFIKTVAQILCICVPVIIYSYTVENLEVSTYFEILMLGSLLAVAAETAYRIYKS